MKQLLIILGLGMAVAVMGQEEKEFRTLFGNDMSSGGYGAPEMKLSDVNGKSSLLMGGRGGWIIGHSFVLGGGGYGLVTNNRFIYDEVLNGVDTTREYRIDMGYGGLLLEYIAMPQRAVHLTFPVLIGAGGVSLSHKLFDENDAEYVDDWSNWEYEESAAFFVVEPGIGIELNMTKFFRLELGASYRYINGTNLRRLSDSDLSDFSLNMALKFGKF